jgi:hypothetical protein
MIYISFYEQAKITIIGEELPLKLKIIQKLADVAQTNT